MQQHPGLVGLQQSACGAIYELPNVHLLWNGCLGVEVRLCDHHTRPPMSPLPQVAISSQTKANGNTLPATLGNTFGGYPSLTPVSGFGEPSVPALGYSRFSAPMQPTFTSFGAPPCHGFNAPSIFGQPFPSAFGSVAPTAYGGVAPTAHGQGARVAFGAAAGSFGGGVPRAQFISDG